MTAYWMQTPPRHDRQLRAIRVVQEHRRGQRRVAGECHQVLGILARKTP